MLRSVRITISLIVLCFYVLVAQGSSSDTIGVRTKILAAADSIMAGKYRYPSLISRKYYAITKKQGYSDLFAKCCRILAKVTEHENKVDSAIYFYNQSLEYYKRSNKLKEMGQVYHNIGSILYVVGRFEESQNAFIKALGLREEIKDTIGIAWTHNNIGNVYEFQNALSDALTHYGIANELFRALNYKEGIALTEGNIALIFDARGDSIEALRRYKYALEANRATGHQLAVANNLSNMGSLLIRMGKFKEAQECYDESLAISLKEQNHSGLDLCYSGLASIAARTGDLLTSEKWILKTIRLNDSVGNRSANMRAFKGLSELYFQMKRYREAYLAMVRCHQISDSINTGDKLAQIEAAYGKEKREKEIKLLQKENDINELELKRKEIMMYSSVLIIILILIAASFFVRNYYLKKKANNELELKNKEILEQKSVIEAKQKEMLDSIIYAKRIQQSLMPSDKYLEKNFEKLKREENKN